MTTLTEQEQRVYTAVHKICQQEYSADMKDICNETGMSLESARGIVGSLTKKKKIHSETGDRPGMVDIFAITDCGSILSFGELT